MFVRLSGSVLVCYVLTLDQYKSVCGLRDRRHM